MSASGGQFTLTLWDKIYALKGKPGIGMEVGQGVGVNGILRGSTDVGRMG